MSRRSCPCRGSCPCHEPRPRRPRGTAQRRWTRPEVDFLKKSISNGATPRETSEGIKREFGFVRSCKAVKTKAADLGLAFRVDFYTAVEVCRALGVNSRRLEGWRDRELLPMRHYVGMYSGKPTRWWRIEVHDVYQFVNRYSGIEFTASVVKDPTLRRLAEVAAVTNRRKAGWNSSGGSLTLRTLRGRASRASTRGSSTHSSSAGA